MPPRLLTSQEIAARIAQKRREVDMPVANFAEALGIREEVVARFERGEVDPLPGDWILLAARALHVDYRYFVTDELDADIDATRRVYRALKTPTPADELALRRFFAFAVGEHELREVLERPLGPLPPESALPSHKNHSLHGRETAEKERDRLGLGVKPIANIFEVLRNQGIILVRQVLRDSTLSGLTVLHPSAGPCALVNYADDLYRQFFSAAHEYAHIIFDRRRINSDGCVVSYEKARDPIEIRANAFAGSFLLPRASLRKTKTLTDDAHLSLTLEHFAREYLVNTNVVLYALADVGWIPREKVPYWEKHRPTIPRVDKSDPDIPSILTASQQQRRERAIRRGLDLRFIELVRSALTMDAISLGRAAELLDIPVADVGTFFREIQVPL